MLEPPGGAQPDAGRAAVATFVAALQTGASRSAAFDLALAAWRLHHPEQSELRAVADVATAIRAFTPAT